MLNNNLFSSIQSIMDRIDPYSKMQSNISRIMETTTLPESLMSAINFARDHTRFAMPTLPDNILKIMEQHERLEKLIAPPIPDNMMRLLESVRSQQERFSSMFESITQTHNTFYKIAQTNSLLDTIAFNTDSILSRFALAGKWDDMALFDEVNDRATSIAEQVINQEYVTLQDLEEFKQVILTAISRVGKEKINQINTWIAIISFLFMIFSEIRYQTQSQAVTIEDLRTFKFEMLDSVSKAINSQNTFRIVTHPCKIYLKPNFKSYVVSKVDSGIEVTILRTYHKWVQVSLVDDEDNFAQFGWIPKKYLAKP